MLGHRLAQVGHGGHGRPDRPGPGQHAQVVDGEHVGRVAHRDREDPVLLAQGDGLMADGDLPRQEPGDLVGDAEQPLQVDEGQLELVGQRLRDLCLVGQAEGDDHLAELAPLPLVGRLGGERLLQRPGAEHARVDQHLAETTAGSGRTRASWCGVDASGGTSH
jgi:hypothetical protein